MHPNKPTWMTRTLGNDIFGALSGDRSVDWVRIFIELVNRLVGRGGKSKSIPIFPFLYHMYESKGLLTEEEETNYRAAKEVTRYWITPDRDPDSESEVPRITAPTPQQLAIAPVNLVKQGNMMKQTYRAPEGSPPVQSRGEGSRPYLGSPQSKGVRLERPQPEQSQLAPQPEP